ncbi:rhodanese-like domain-containing protein [Sorangium sp. So ce1128]
MRARLGKPIVVYCASARRAQQVKDVLLEAGYEQVTNLGGIDDWGREQLRSRYAGVTGSSYA